MARGCDGFPRAAAEVHWRPSAEFKIEAKVAVEARNRFLVLVLQHMAANSATTIPGEREKRAGPLFAWQAGTNPKELVAADQLPWLAAHHGFSHPNWLQGNTCSHMNSAPPGLKQGPKKARRESLAQSQSERAACRRHLRYRTGPAARQVEGRRRARRDSISIWACNFSISWAAAKRPEARRKRDTSEDKMMMAALQMKGEKRSSKGCWPISVSRGASWLLCCLF